MLQISIVKKVPYVKKEKAKAALLSRRGRLEPKPLKKGRISSLLSQLILTKTVSLFLGPVLLDEFVEWQKVRQIS